MNWAHIHERIQAGEDALTEFRRDATNIGALARAVCAFANGSGGLLVVGVDDNGTLVGVSKDPEAVQERLTSLLHDVCGRPVAAECGRHRIEGERWIHWIDVHRHQGGYEPFASEGHYWIRRDRATVRPSPSELRELLNAFGLVLTEQQVIPSATVDDIDFSAVRTFLRAQGMDPGTAPRPTRPEDLLVASVADEVDGVARPTLYGLIVFGRQPQAHPHTHNLFVQCARYDGRDRSADVLSVAEGTGRLEDQVRQCMGWYRSLGRREEYRGLERIDIPMVPELALREALVNAVVHREYAITGSSVLLEVFSDRIAVTSPGTLPNHMTVERAKGGGASRSRNEMMANAMVVRRLTDRRGRGWLVMRQTMRQFNGTEPTLENDPVSRLVRVTFPFASAAEPEGSRAEEPR